MSDQETKPICQTERHSGFGKPEEDCSDPECVVKSYFGPEGMVIRKVPKAPHFLGWDRPRDYSSIGRKVFLVEDLPASYEKDIDVAPLLIPMCEIEGHPGFGKLRKDCTGKECAVQVVLNK